MEKNQKNKKIITISIISVVLLVIIGTVIFMVLSNSQKLKLYNSTLELGQEDYTEKLTEKENVYIKDGYTYSIKENNIDINNVGTYDLIFEIKGKGKTKEEVKKVIVVDTTPPTITLKKDSFYMGDNINIEEIVEIKDLSQEGEISYTDAKATTNGQFDTSTEGEKSVEITAQDSSGNKTTQTLTINVKNPIVNLYDYVMANLDKSIFTDGSYDDKFVLKFSYNFNNGLSSEGWINFSEKVYYEYTKLKSFLGTVKTANLVYFDDDYNVNKVYIDNNIYDGDKSTYQSSVSGEVNRVDSMINNKNKKIRLAGKTIEQLKNETIDLRELE